MNDQTVLAKSKAKAEQENSCSRSARGEADTSRYSKLKELKVSLGHCSIAIHPLQRLLLPWMGKLLVQSLDRAFHERSLGSLPS